MGFLGFIDRVYDKKISAKGLGVFRIFFSLNLFLEVFRIFRYRQLYFDPIPFIDISSFDYTIPLLLWMFILLLLVLGLFTKVVSILSYIFTLWIINDSSFFEYHMNYTYLGVGFIMMFIPLSNSYSLDNLWKKYKKVTHLPNQRVSVLYHYLIIFFGLAVVYFDSLFFKFKCDLWMRGLGVWLPASIPQITISKHQWLLNQEIIIKGLGYLTFFFELIFPFTFFIKKLRPYLLVIGLGLHIGILIEFPIPYFAIGVLAIYLLMVPVSFWDKLEGFLLNKRINNLHLEDINEVATHFKFNLRKTNIYIIKILVVFLVVLQFNSIFNFPLSKSIVNRVTYSYKNLNKPIKNLKSVKRELRLFSHHFFGITPHGVFVDNHFKGYDKYFSVKYNGKLLPMYNNEGMPDEYLQGGSWINYSYRVNKPYVLKTPERLKAGLIRYTSFWANENNIDLNDTEFEIIMKRVKISFEWEKDFLKNNLATPWEKVGVLTWKNNKAEVSLYVIK